MNNFKVIIYIILISSIDFFQISGQNPYMIKDIVNSGKFSDSNPRGYIEFKNELYFIANGVSNTSNGTGYGIWKTDGTQISIVKRFDYSVTPQFTISGNLLYFELANNQIWKTDGTTNGTVLVKDGFQYGTIKNLQNLNNKLIFSASVSSYREELWITDGTSIGTKKLVNFDLRIERSIPSNFVLLDNKIYFSANDGTHGNELWVTDGTENGTIMVKDLNLGINSSNPQNLSLINNKIYFSASSQDFGNELWVTNGLETNTYQIKDLNIGLGDSSPNGFTFHNGFIYFQAKDINNDVELWKSDGTNEGTTLLININSSVSSRPNNFVSNGFFLFFVANSGEIWRTDGTLNGTQQIENFGPINYQKDVQIKNHLGEIFIANYGGYLNQLWKTDGNNNVLLKKFSDRNSNYGTTTGILDLTTFNGEMFFSADDGNHGFEVWRSNGTEIGTKIAFDLNSSLTDSSSPKKITKAGSNTFFLADHINDELVQYHLWKTDGSKERTEIVKCIGNCTFSDPYIWNLTEYGDKLIFSTRDEGLWITDGTELGTINFKYLRVIEQSFFVFNGILYFSANDLEKGHELWRTDGTTEGTLLVKDIFINEPTIYGGSNPRNFFIYNNLLHFTVNDGGLWKTDGSENGTVKVIDFPNGYPLGVINNKIILSKNNFIDGLQFWFLEETASEPILFKDFLPGNDSERPEFVTKMGEILYFKIFKQLWRTDGTSIGTYKVKDVLNYRLDPSDIFNFNGILIFTGNDDPTANNYELWRSDGTTNGTFKLKELNPGTMCSCPGNFVNANGKLYFSASGDNYNVELWESDGTSNGTKLVKDIFEGPTGSYPRSMTFSNNKLYFTAYGKFDKYDYGTELWTIGNCETSVYTIPNNSNALNFNFQTQANQTCHCDIFNNLISTFEKIGANPIDATNTTTRVFNDKIQSKYFVKRHYEITPQTNPNTSTGKLTTYFLQNEFDTYNAIKSIDLPANNIDNIGKANLRIVKYSGTSSDGSGLPSTYAGAPTVINPADDDIVWNETAQRWEVTFETVGFGGFFIRAGSICTTTQSGNWNDPAIWSCGVVPSYLDDVIIAPGHNITMPDGYTGLAQSIENNGSLIFKANSYLNLTGQ